MNKAYVILDDNFRDVLYWCNFSQREYDEIIEEQLNNDSPHIVFKTESNGVYHVELTLDKSMIVEIDLGEPFTEGNTPNEDGTYVVSLSDVYDVDVYENGQWKKYFADYILGYKKLTISNKNL